MLAAVALQYERGVQACVKGKVKFFSARRRWLSTRIQHARCDPREDANHNSADDANYRPCHRHQLARRKRGRHSLQHRRLLRMSSDVAVKEKYVRARNPDTVHDA